MFGRQVVVPSFEGATSCSGVARLVKKFLGRNVSDVPREQLSFQSIKKGLPDSCPCMERGLLDKLALGIGRSPRDLPGGYLDFVRKEVGQLFKKGWDASYESHCLTVSPPLSSVYVPSKNCDDGTPLCSAAGSRSTGGCLGWLGADQDEYLDCVLHGLGEVGEVRGELMVVQSAGKPRPLSKFEASALALKPLHKTLYGHLKKRSWLLSGPPTKEKMRRAGFREGCGDLVSGDYASATDGLSIEVAQAILETVLSSSVFVPTNIREAAVALLRPLLLWGDDREFEVRVSTGQMMGSYLSFPLLCLQNYLAFRWSLRGTGVKKVPVLINGDDILYQLSGHYDRWERTLSAVGLTVESTKTSVEVAWGTINSTLLEWSDGYLVPGWSARFGMFRPAEHPGSLGRSFQEFLFDLNEPDLRYRAGKEFFKWHASELRSAGVSPVSLGFRGLLARRLSKQFQLLDLPLVEFVGAFDKHKVSYDGDFVCRHDLDALSAEELYMSSLELGSDKWNRGWMPAKVGREAILYCLRRTELKGNRNDYSFDPRPFFATDSEFSFLKRNLGTRSVRPVGSKPFLSPFPARRDVLVSWTLFQSLTPQFGDFEDLPPYREFVESDVA
jgi:hypothetical protein